MNRAIQVLSDITEHHRLLLATTRIELMKRYAGSALGFAWIVLNPLLFLSVYLFVYLVIFRTSLPDMTPVGYSIFIFSALVPFLAFMETANGSVTLIRANMHLVKNLVFPPDLIPIRLVLTVFVAEFVGLAMLFALAAADGGLSWKLALLPPLLCIQFLFLVGVAFLCAGFGVLLPDFGYFLNSFLMLLLFLSPIGYKLGTLSGGVRYIAILNPLTYMIEAFRSVLIGAGPIDFHAMAVYLAMSVVAFCLGSVFFARLRAHLVDYE
jgi:lipopolysaccharide transport system permease protein